MAEVTTILTKYRRPQNIRPIAEAVRNQTQANGPIWLWENHHQDCSVDEWTLYNDAVDRVCTSDYNWKFFGRFAMATMVDTEYVALFDDDTIPGEKWFENCLNTMKTHEGLMGSAGVILTGPYYRPHTRYGWSSQNRGVVEVDLVGHAWFLKTEWIRHFWAEKPYTWQNGEDIHLSYMLQRIGIKTYCPPHPAFDKSLHGSLKGQELGTDDVAESNNKAVSHEEFFAQRDACVQHCIKNGWRPLFTK